MTLARDTHDATALSSPRTGLDAALDQIAAMLLALAQGAPQPVFAPPRHSALPFLAEIFGLDHDALTILALACGHELRDEFGAAIAAVAPAGMPTPSLAATLIGPRAWDCLCPDAPLRHWRLVELQGTGPLRNRTIRLDERILHALLGTRYTDARLDGLVRRCTPPEPPDRSGRAPVARIAQAWSGARSLPLILLEGADPQFRRAIATEAADNLGLVLLRLDAADIPADWAQRDTLRVLVDRELALSGAALVIEADPDSARAAARFADALCGPTILSAAEAPSGERAPRVRLHLDGPDQTARHDIWRGALGQRAEAVGDTLDRLSAHFAIDAQAIGAAVAEAAPSSTPPAALAPALWDAARAQARGPLDGLADRIESRAGWEDLVLPAEQMATLRDLEAHVRDAWRVDHQWGWAARTPRGLGAASLFAGPSGTGKTLAAEALAGALRLDLYRIDLSQVVSKYIGETEKNLARVFAAAERGGAILLFDEADALFGKRSEVRDSHDRHANVEVSYLLQKMESYRGLAILTTNLKADLDTAFLRRLRYVVTFPFPDSAARAAIWARIFPAQTPRAGLDPAALARLNVSGGSIRSIALNAAYLAASVPEPVGMGHIRRAARREFAKLEKPFTAAEKEAFR